MELPFDISNTLKYGAIGLGAIMGILSYFLLRNEQKRNQPRKNVFNAIYVFMVFSVLLFSMGILSELRKKSDKPLTKEISIKSGFEKGALTGTYTVEGTDVEFLPENFRVPRHRYKGQIEITDEGDKIVLEGFLDTYKFTGDSLHPFNDTFKATAPFKAIGTINNNYVAGTYIYGTKRVNGFGTILMEFNNAASEAKSYLQFRTTTGNARIGTACFWFTRKQ